MLAVESTLIKSEESSEEWVDNFTCCAKKEIYYSELLAFVSQKSKRRESATTSIAW